MANEWLTDARKIPDEVMRVVPSLVCPYLFMI
jgi:hypothetical protein